MTGLITLGQGTESPSRLERGPEEGELSWLALILEPFQGNSSL